MDKDVRFLRRLATDKRKEQAVNDFDRMQLDEEAWRLDAVADRLQVYIDAISALHKAMEVTPESSE